MGGRSEGVGQGGYSLPAFVLPWVHSEPSVCLAVSLLLYPGVEEFLVPVENAVQEFFVPAMPQEKVRTITHEFHQLLTQGVKQGGMNLRNTVKAAVWLHQSYSKACTTLVTPPKENIRLDSLAHARCMRQASVLTRNERVDEEKGSMAMMMVLGSRSIKKQLVQIGQTGAWLT